MTLSIVDAFTAAAFSGNPAAVCLLEAPADAAWMQALAAEMNLSETAFVVPDGSGAFGLRWFTPTAEVDLCGHATLASAHVLFEMGALPTDGAAQFDTRSGRLVVIPAGMGRYTMDFPATPPAAVEAPAGTRGVFGATAWTGMSRFDLFLVLPGEAAVRALAPDPAAVAALGARGVIATAQADVGADYDVVSRFFAPAVGVPEDPVTGSAHCAIAPFWSERLEKPALRCIQASRRGGTLGVEVRGERVLLTGDAVTVLRGEIAAPALP